MKNKNIHVAIIAALVTVAVVVVYFMQNNQQAADDSKKDPFISQTLNRWSVTPKGSILLSGFDAHDPDGGDIAWYEWSIVSAPPEHQDRLAETVYAGKEYPSVEIPVTSDDVGQWTFELTIRDDEGAQAMAGAIVTVRERIDAIVSATLVQKETAGEVPRDEMVVGVVVDGVAAAFPRSVMGHHAIANALISGEPIVVIFCEFCQTGIAYNRFVSGRVLTFQTLGGTLLEDDYVAKDLETDTTWRIIEGKATEGELAEMELDSINLTLATWEGWLAEHPDTLVLVDG
ncbi:MAG: hypothetical protein A2898_00480 [Candidatus Kerfeldbacteria bacterium RIFCSPLOWO2_01_FULL_48_11]|uniref:DUF3179 domain-containing protein n=1 Tax=Candidatus Kerfeldbacteria bacterium RIFCSPLOWO2_01_FULL_48_11 TaxID=1798543 RepID=A0A1G2B2M5_9BACT|nr:MAG: hypothetical protein UY34_C0019G0027 [Parcubacteria group bacterium GW2011_GWA2_48_9]OGY82986.1 MAG: hypothetical protein A2898_00480 [Candidatus Kerfeldbacteria bacterium RIFCSPLOWO2_01_FULL_48_11]